MNYVIPYKGIPKFCPLLFIREKRSVLEADIERIDKKLQSYAEVIILFKLMDQYLAY